MSAVAEILDRLKPRSVLDMGCNRGSYAVMATLRGARVSAFDADEDSVALLHASAHNHQLAILPLVSALVSNFGIMPTILDLLGVTHPTAWVEGESLLRAGQDSQRLVYVHRPSVQEGLAGDFEFSDGRSCAVLRDHLVLVNRDGELALFDLAQDSLEHTNLVGQRDAGDLVGALEQFSRRSEFVDSQGKVLEAPALVAR